MAEPTFKDRPFRRFLVCGIIIEYYKYVDMNQKGISNFIIMGMAVFIIIIAGSSSYYLINKEKKQENTNQEQDNNQNQNQNQNQQTPMSITVISPNGGEVWKPGETHDITWQSAGVDNVVIWLARKGETDVAEGITGSSHIAASLGKYTWTIPTNNSDINLGGEFKIIVGNADLSNQYVRDASDNYFDIEKGSEGVKEFFHATEIINNNLPRSIEFWTEAYCPSDGTNYDYIVPLGFDLYYCDKNDQEVGTHGGCSTCIMSKIQLVKSYFPFNSSFDISDCKYRPYQCPVLMGLLTNDISVFENGLSSEIVNSDSLLKKYVEEFTGKTFEQILVQRGNFDKNSDNSMVVASFCQYNCLYSLDDGLSYSKNKGFNDHIAIINEGGSLKVFYFPTHSVVRNANLFLNKPLYLIYGGKPFFIGSGWGCGATTNVGCGQTFYLFQFIDGELTPRQILTSTWEGFTYSSTLDKEEYVIDIVKQVEFNDIDGDANEEIIFSKESFTGKADYDSAGNITNKNDLNDFRDYQTIFKWDKKSEYFLELKG
jgi:hypothetical protein